MKNLFKCYVTHFLLFLTDYIESEKSLNDVDMNLRTRVEKYNTNKNKDIYYMEATKLL